MKDFLKKVGRFLKGSGLHLLFCAVVIAGVYFVATNAITDADTAEAEKSGQGDYAVVPGDKLFALRDKELADVTSIVVVVAGYFDDSRHVLIKHKDKQQVDFYMGVNSEGFTYYRDTFLKNFISQHPGIDLRFMGALKGVGTRLGVSSDPTAVMVGETTKDALSGAWKFLSTVIFMVVLIAVMMRMQMGSMTNNLDRIDPKDIDDDLEDLVGMADIKKELHQLQGMIENRQLFKEYANDKPFNVMMTGPAGVGKTKTARCLAKSLNIPMFYASAASLETGYVGGGPRTLKNLVKRASKEKRCIIFLDEAESVLASRNRPTRSRYENETMTTLLSLLDGVNTKKESGIIWIVASNFDEVRAEMDEAMLRRFPLKINFRLPNHEERREIMSRLLAKMDKSKVASDIDLNHVAGIATGMSPAILETLVSRAGLIALQEAIPVNHSCMLRAFERVAVGLTDRATTAKVDETRKVVAIHEAGHFIMHLHTTLKKHNGDLKHLHDTLDTIKISTESVSKLGALGFVLSKTEEVALNSRNEYMDKIRHLYGGMANEEIYLGEAGTTAGADNDISKVTQLLDMMVNRVGFFSPVKLNYGELSKAGYNTDDQLPKIEQLSENIYRETLDTLRNFQPLTNSLVDALMADYVLTLDDIIPHVLEFFTTHARQMHHYNDDWLNDTTPAAGAACA
jgi:cell division protease FtsH